MDEADVPRRAYRLVLDLEADTYDDMLSTIDQLCIDLCHNPKHDGGETTSGGYSSGYHVEIIHRARQTGDRYRRELAEWCDRRRAERAAKRAQEATDE